MTPRHGRYFTIMDAKVTLSITSLSTHIEYAPLKYNDGGNFDTKTIHFINHPV